MSAETIRPISVLNSSDSAAIIEALCRFSAPRLWEIRMAVAPEMMLNTRLQIEMTWLAALTALAATSLYRLSTKMSIKPSSMNSMFSIKIGQVRLSRFIRLSTGNLPFIITQIARMRRPARFCFF